MRMVILLTVILFVCICTYSIYEYKTRNVSALVRTREWYGKAVDDLDRKAGALSTAITGHQSVADIQTNFLKTRLAYKRVEFAVEYYNPYTAQAVNSPVEKDEEPAAFQELETLLFPTLEKEHEHQALIAATRLAAVANRLHLSGHSLVATDAQLFDAMRLELVRIMALSLSRFDSHHANNSLPEAASALNGVQEIWRFYAPEVKVYNPSLEKYTGQLLAACEQQLQHPDNFDRQQLVDDYINPLSVNLKLAREALHIPYDGQVFVIDPAASSFFAKDAIDAYYSRDTLYSTAHEFSGPVYEIDGRFISASYIYGLLRQNSNYSAFVNASN